LNMNEKLRKGKEIEHWRKFKDVAENFWGWGTPAGQKRAERRAQYLIKLADIKSGRRILEVGCGTGIYTEKLVKTGAEIIAIDLSPDLLAKARSKIVNVGFLETDLENLPFSDQNFDAVVGVSILHHVNVEKALKEIKRVLKSGGSIVFSEPNMLNPQIFAERKINWLRKAMGDSPNETAFFRWRLARALRNVGFSEIRVKPFDFLHPLTPKPFIKIVERLGFAIENIPLLKEFAGSLLITATRP